MHEAANGAMCRDQSVIWCIANFSALLRSTILADPGAADR